MRTKPHFLDDAYNKLRRDGTCWNIETIPRWFAPVFVGAQVIVLVGAIGMLLEGG